MTLLEATAAKARSVGLPKIKTNKIKDSKACSTLISVLESIYTTTLHIIIMYYLEMFQLVVMMIGVSECDLKNNNLLLICDSLA